MPEVHIPGQYDAFPIDFQQRVEPGEWPDGEFPWWLTKHPLVIPRPAQVLGDIDPQTYAQEAYLDHQVLNNLALSYGQRDCPVVVVSEDGQMFNVWQGRDYQPSEEKSPYGVIAHSVYMGELPRATRRLALPGLRHLPEWLNSPDIRPPDVEDKWKGYLTRNLLALGLENILRHQLPEVEVDLKEGKGPYVAYPGRRIVRQMNLEPKLFPHLVNFIYTPDYRGDIAHLPYHSRQIYGWMEMAKTGSFQTAIVPWRIKDGQFEHELVFHTLEGGFVDTTPERLWEFTMPYGSAYDVDSEPKELKDVNIPRKVWEQLPEIQGLIELGRFCGERDLLSPPVDIGWFTHNPELGSLEKELAGYGGQAEGAFYTFIVLDKKYNIGDLLEKLDRPVTGLQGFTTSGRFRTIKTLLTLLDFAVVGGFEDDTVLVVPIEGLATKGPSIEGFEIGNSQEKLIEKDRDRFTIRLRRVDGGYVIDQEGDIVVPAWRGVLHKHRGLAKAIPPYAYNLNTWRHPAFGCGNRLVHDVTEEMLVDARNAWEASGRQAICAYGELRRHGGHTILFWTEEENGVIPENPVKQFMQAVERGLIGYTRQVPMW